MFCVIGEQWSCIDDRNLVFYSEQIDIVLGIEAPGPCRRLNLRAIPDGAISKYDFLNTRLVADKMVFHQHRIKGQNACDILKLDQEVIALTHDRDVLWQDARLDNHPVDIAGSAELGYNIIVAVKAQYVIIRAKSALQIILPIAAIEAVIACAADEGVGKYRAHQHLDIDQRIARCFSAEPLAQRQIDGNRLVGTRIIRDIETAAAVDDVSAKPAAEAIVARIAAHDIIMI